MRNVERITRRALLGGGLAGLLAAGQWPGALRGDDPPAGEFTFVAVNDLHYHDARCGDWLQGAFRQMTAHAEKPAFVLVVGDLAEHGTPAELGPMRDLLKAQPVPAYPVIGNHDYQPPNDRQAFEELFPGRLNYEFEHRGWRFLGLDTTAGTAYALTTIQPPTFAWLEAALAKIDRRQPIVVFTHFPLGEKVTTRPENADALLARLAGYNLRAVYSGHYHAFTERAQGQTVLTTNRCCALKKQNHDGSKEKGYFLCRVKDGQIHRTFVEVKAG